MLSRHSGWLIATLVAVGVLMLGGLVWASPPASSPSVPPMATPGLDADKVDGFHAASSSAGAAARANKLLAAGSSGKFTMGVLPTGQLDSRYVNDDRAETISGASGGALLTVDNTGTGNGLFGDGGTGGDGLSGRASASNKSGVFGYNSGSGYGVCGRSANGWGIEADGNDSSNADRVGDLVLRGNIGEIFSFGHLGLYADQDAYIDLDDNNDDANAKFVIFDGTNTFRLTLDEGGNLWTSGTKNALVQTEDYGQRLLYAMESTGVWFEDFGTASLVEGVAKVAIEPIFAETVNLDDYHIFLTPLGECKGLYVAKKTATSFEVRELGGGTSNIEFDYRIVAKRLGYEDVRMEAIAADTLTRE